MCIWWGNLFLEIPVVDTEEEGIWGSPSSLGFLSGLLGDLEKEGS